MKYLVGYLTSLSLNFASRSYGFLLQDEEEEHFTRNVDAARLAIGRNKAWICSQYPRQRERRPEDQQQLQLSRIFSRLTAQQRQYCPSRDIDLLIK